MTHAINSNTGLLSIDYITRMHTQVRKSPRGEKESGKEKRHSKEKRKKMKNKEKMKKRKIKKN